MIEFCTTAASNSKACHQMHIFKHFLAQNYSFKVCNVHIQYIFYVANDKMHKIRKNLWKMFEFYFNFCIKKIPIFGSEASFKAFNMHIHYEPIVVDRKIHNFSHFYQNRRKIFIVFAIFLFSAYSWPKTYPSQSLKKIFTTFSFKKIPFNWHLCTQIEQFCVYAEVL